MQLWREIRKVWGLLCTAESARSKIKRLSWSSLICASWFSGELATSSVELGFVGGCIDLSVMIISRRLGSRGMP
jgi:hypothetical protein